MVFVISSQAAKVDGALKSSSSMRLHMAALASFVFAFAFFAFLEVSLIAFVNFRAVVLECSPYILADVFCHRSYVAPFVMKLLQAFECGDYVRLVYQLCRFCHKKLLFGKIFLKS